MNVAGRHCNAKRNKRKFEQKFTLIYMRMNNFLEIDRMEY